MTKEEKRLWYDFFKKLPISFKRQKVIGKYIVDFICTDAKLIVEVDGEQHYSDFEVRYSDEQRDEYFKDLGLKVLRISNGMVNKNFKGACIEILKYLPRECSVEFLGEYLTNSIFK